MKTVKPLRLGILTRPYRWKQQDQLGVSVFAWASLAAEPQLMAEQELWLALAEDIGPSGVFDMGVPKLAPEVLASGYGYTSHQEDKTSCAVRIQVAGLQKTLTVSGDRYWLDGRLTAPLPFDRMRLDWRHAYGGPGVPENPLGIGAFDEIVQGVRTRRAPNVEAAGAHMKSPGHAPAAASFDALPVDWPQRMALMGSKYGQHWLEQEFPGFAQDMDWHFFNAALPDQRWSDLADFPSSAPYEILNMHPTQPVLRGCLPNWVARCFASSDKDGHDLREVPLRLTTAWFFPHRERVALIWHGALAVREDDAADIRHIMPALELQGEPRPHAHYQAVLHQRIDPARGGLLAFRDSDLAPKAVLGRWSAIEASDAMARPMVRNVRAGLKRDHESRRMELLAAGLDPDKYLPAPMVLERAPEFDDVPEYFERMEKELKQSRRELAAQSQQMRLAQEQEIDPALLEESRRQPQRFDPDQLIRQLDQLDRSPGEAPASAPLLTVAMKERMTMQIRLGYLYGAHLSDAAPAMPSFRAAKIRRRLTEAPPDQRNFSGMTLVGADLSGMDLRGANFSGAALEDANLSEAMLDGADFSNAVLARTKLVRTSLANARLNRANLGGAQCEYTNFAGADLSEANCEKARLLCCNVSGARLEQTRWLESVLDQCDFRRSEWRQVSMMKLTLSGIAFGDALFDQVAWLECTLQDVSFAGAALNRSSFVATDCSQAVDFSDARLEASSFAHGSSLEKAILRRATLKHCGLRTTPMRHADLGGAQLDGSDLSECDLQGARLDGIAGGESLFVRADFTGASLRGANLIDANLSKAIFSRADLREANLFRADVSQALIDGTTDLGGAYTRDAKVWPARRVEPNP
ncbi:putative low-complexity protein [Variovorax sp. CF313]|jgi:uncharacterized protein YjbI with pentapeptide repeats|uniref:DUF2169 family type VI secretion system accessory protein n=1 Tax=Variovorax sp. CF313 TaxID=1144315 RepID=UPI0002713E3C|nr:DUF2169 domain-containing protein [Variovorax sp. CF313]EJL76657.1 putative low-complexity protein [Variovorax sp. CF313]